MSLLVAIAQHAIRRLTSRQRPHSDRLRRGQAGVRQAGGGRRAQQRPLDHRHVRHFEWLQRNQCQAQTLHPLRCALGSSSAADGRRYPFGRHAPPATPRELLLRSQSAGHDAFGSACADCRRSAGACARGDRATPRPSREGLTFDWAESRDSWSYSSY